MGKSLDNLKVCYEQRPVVPPKDWDGKEYRVACPLCGTVTVMHPALVFSPHIYFDDGDNE